MYLKSLELYGFKSFSEKTILKFDSPRTVIVGPNGSGKSNITDAMRWVLGELSSKTIRGSKMEDVIFVGSDKRKPMGYAEVSVTFANSETDNRLNSPYDEITVTRRYYRAGESEYFINRKAVRLKDIYELFMNTGIGREGYSIIGQGKIAEIISKKSEDRRNIFEEAAGISKFKYKKNEAERHLSATEENMLRAGDILSELSARVEPLEKESAKARKYLELFEAKKKADVSLWLYDSEHLRIMTGESESACRISEHELEMCDDTIGQLEAQNDRLFGASQNNKLNSEKRYTELKEKNKVVSELEAEHRVLLNNSEHSVVSLEAEEKNQERIRELIVQNESEYGKKSEFLDELNKKLPDYENQKLEYEAEYAKISDYEKKLKASLNSLLNEQKNLENSQMDLKVRISVLKNSQKTDAEKNGSIEEDIKKYELASTEFAKKIAQSIETVDLYKASLGSLEEKLLGYDSEIETGNIKINQLRIHKNNLSGENQALSERISALKKMDEHFDGYQNSVKFIMKKKESGEFSDKAGEIYGPISRLISVKEENIIAVETSLGANMQNIIVEDEDTAIAAIEELKKANAGRATFYPLTSVKFQGRTGELESASNFEGFVGYGDGLVSCDSKFSEVILSLLGRTAVFDNIDNATKMAKALKYKVRAVTLDGQQINVGGSFTGGSAKRDSGMLTRANEIEKLEKSCNEIAKKVEIVDNELKESESKVWEISKKRKIDEEQKLISETLLRAEMSASDGLTAKKEVNDNLVNSLKEDIIRLREMEKKSEDDVKNLTSQLDGIGEKIQKISSERNSIESERYALEYALSEISDKQNEHLIRFAEYKKDIEAAELALLDSDRRLKESMTELKSSEEKAELLKSGLSEAKSEIEANRSRYEVLAKEIAVLEEERAALEAGGMEYEKKLNDLRLKIREATNKKETALRAHTKNEAKLTQLKGDFDKMSTRLWDEYELTHTAAVELGYPKITETNRASVSAVLNDCKSKLKALGSVNVGAIDEYTEVKGRFDFLDKQMKDLEKSKDELTKIITDLEKEMRSSFIEAFEKINENFNDVFRELFGGGNAEISLTDPDDVLSSGIEIKAAPPGKMIKSLTLLSGGEQAFVAIALLFAVLKANPTPFCIFDEIEAALDEVNVVRFAEYIKQYSLQTQFIIITHRRGTMEIAEKLYGVTMPERGVSKVLSMDLNLVDGTFVK